MAASGSPIGCLANCEIAVKNDGQPRFRRTFRVRKPPLGHCPITGKSAMRRRRWMLKAGGEWCQHLLASSAGANRAGRNHGRLARVSCSAKAICEGGAVSDTSDHFVVPFPLQSDHARRPCRDNRPFARNCQRNSNPRYVLSSAFGSYRQTDSADLWRTRIPGCHLRRRHFFPRDG